jgi:hypothetical protein
MAVAGFGGCRVDGGRGCHPWRGDGRHRRRHSAATRHKKRQSGSCSFGDAPGQQVIVDARLARFPFEVEGRHFGLQRTAIGIKEFKQGRFAALVGGFGDTEQIGRFADGAGAVIG